MPFRPGLDDDPSLSDLISLWQAGADDLERRALAIWRRVDKALAADVIDRHVIKRLQLEAVRVEALLAVSDRVVRDLVNGTREWIEAGGVHRVYAAGGSLVTFPFEWATPHRDAVAILAGDLFDDVLTATKFIDADAKRFVRKVGRELTNVSLTGGRTAVQSGRSLRRRLQSEFVRRGIGKIRYADGSRRSFATYAEMLLRTKTGQVYNLGTAATAARSGVTHMELFDGRGCGLTSHNDGTEADGMIVPVNVALSYPLAHPNCRRAMAARPDIRAPGAVGTIEPGEAGQAFTKAVQASLRTAQERSGGDRRRSRRSRRRRAARPARV